MLYIYMYIAECYTECLTNNVVGDIQVHGVDFRSLEGHLASRNQTWFGGKSSEFDDVPSYKPLYIYG
jgi:hypothetical protein